MSDLKISYLLGELSKPEKNRFLKFVRSPYFNTDKKLIQLTKLLLTPPFTRESLHTPLFPGMPYDYFRISTLITYVYKLLEEFLAYERMKKSDFPLQHHSLILAKEQGWNSYFEEVSRKFARKQQRTSSLLPEDFLKQYLIEQERDTYFSAQQQRTANDSLSLKLEALELFHVSAMLKNVCKWINRQNIIRSEEANNYEHFIGYIRQHIDRFSSEAFVRIYFPILMTLIDWENEAHYHQLRIALQEDGPKIPVGERKPMYQYAQNYCARQINNGNTAYTRELFGLYQDMIQQELLYHEGHISAGDVKNIVSLSIRLEEYAWASAFLEQEAGRFPSQLREHILAYNHAQLAYARGELTIALRLLRAVEFRDLYYELGAKTLLLKIYYDLDDLEGLESLLHAFSTFLRRNKHISAYQLRVHQNLIRAVKRVNQLRYRKRLVGEQAFIKQLAALEHTIRQKREITNIGWLLEKVEALK